MGSPRKQHKKFKTPIKLWDKARLGEELKLIGEYGLRNKREIWRHRTFLSMIRHQGREIQAMSPDMQPASREKLVKRAHRLGLLEAGQETVDDLLNLTLRDICNRRLQTFVIKKGLACTVNQARQLITHKHIAIDGQIVNAPSHLVLKSEENFIAFAPGSPFIKTDHPMREQIDSARGGTAATMEENKQ